MFRCLFRGTLRFGGTQYATIANRQVSARLLAASVLGIGLFLPSVSGAIPYTLTNSIAITGGEPGNPGVVGTLHPVALDASLSDPLGLSSGDASFVTNDVVVVRLSLAAGSTSVESLGIGVNSNPLFGNPVGAGTYADAGQAPSSVSASGALLLAQFDFTPDTLDASESSVRLFVTYNPEGAALGLGHRTINFMIKSGTNFTVVGTLIPEPEGIVLVAFGIVCIALRQRHALHRARR